MPAAYPEPEQPKSPAASAAYTESGRQDDSPAQAAAAKADDTDIPGISDAELRELESLLQELAATFTIS